MSGADDNAAMVERAQGRQFDPGANAILLDMKGDIGTLLATTNSISARLAIVEPVLWQLETERQRKIGLQQGVARYITLGRATWAAVVVAAAWAAQHIPGWPGK